MTTWEYERKERIALMTPWDMRAEAERCETVADQFRSMGEPGVAKVWFRKAEEWREHIRERADRRAIR